MDTQEKLISLWKTGVQAVRGTEAVGNFLQDFPLDRPDSIIAVGKAASAMAQAALGVFPDTPCLIVTKYAHAKQAPHGARVIEAAHPVPDASSLAAGNALVEAVAHCGPNSRLLMLVSGGASSLAEHLPDGMSLEDLARETQALLASGADIHAMNARRKDISLIKGGKLLARFRGQSVTTLALSDVEGDALSVIGSGIGDAPDTHAFAFAPHIIASNAIVRDAIAKAASLPIHANAETLYADVNDLAEQLGQTLRAGPPGLYIWGGEPTVVLPTQPGKGGRNMALGLSLAREIAGHDIDLLVAGTDGTDGPTDAAGALVNGQTWGSGAAEALAVADAYPWLDRHGALFRSGPTGTNVMDIALAIKHA